MGILRFIAQALNKKAQSLNERADRMANERVERRRLMGLADDLRKESDELVQQGSEAGNAGDSKLAEIFFRRALGKRSEAAEVLEQLAECTREWDPDLAAECDAAAAENHRYIAEQITQMISREDLP